MKFVRRDQEISSASAVVAVKLQNWNIDHSIVKHEAEILKDLGGLDTVPRYIDHGLKEGREYLIMVTGGEDMSNLRDRERRCVVRLVPLPVTIFCMKQMLLCLKDLLMIYTSRCQTREFVRRVRIPRHSCY